MPAFSPPSNSELDCLVVLWDLAAGPDSGKALRVSEIHRHVCDRRRANGEPEPTVVTISSQIRSLLQKHLVRCVVGGAADSDGGHDTVLRTRGMLSPSTRSPMTAYQFLHEPGKVLQSTFAAMIAAYPEGQRGQALIDFAAAVMQIDSVKSSGIDVRLNLLQEVGERLQLPPAVTRKIQSASKRRRNA